MKPISTLNRPHVLAVGASGGGKSTALRRLAREEILAGRGLLLIDPHGDLAAEVLSDVPRNRRNDVTHINALDPERCPGLNPFRGVTEASRAIVTSHVLAALKRLAGSSWGFRTEHVLRAAVLAVLATRSPTLLDVERMLFDASFRTWVLKQVTDERVARFWTTEWVAMGRTAGEAAAAPANKLAAVLASPQVRTILTKNRPRFDARRAMDGQRIVVASLPKGLVGDECTILGSLLLSRFTQAAMGRANVPPAQRLPFTIIVDELSNFTSPTSALAEGRKFGLAIVLATQSAAILPPEERAALLSNVGRLLVFRVMAVDAELLAPELVRFGPRTLTGLAVGEYVERITGRDAQLVTPPAPVDDGAD